MKDIRIYVAAHKKVKQYASDDCYEILHVGASCHEDDYGYICDNVGENTSKKNPMYCELTGMYWMWKNAPKSKYIGLCHYRRYPAIHSYSLKPENEILSAAQLLELLKGVDILLPEKLKKTEANSFCKSFEQLEKCREYRYIRDTMLEKCPEYVTTLNDVFMASQMSFGNIFVMSQDNFNAYCKWLFDLLFEIENRIKEKNDEVPREYGYLSEWMLNVWVQHNKLKVKYIPTIFTEERHNLKFFMKWLMERGSIKR